MSDLQQPAAAERRVRAAESPVLILFSAALFLSALLLFAVQPMFAKMVLPVLGGSPAVWSVAMCFFQSALLAGYAYAHWTVRHVRTPLAVLLQLAMLMAAMVFLPLELAEGWGRPPEEGLHVWVLALFGVSIGLPFFALAGNAPLLQAWFARTGYRHADDPYFLYGASNLGSLLALLSYPVLIEPAATLAQQAGLWSLGFKMLAVLVGVCGFVMLVTRQPKPSMRAQASEGPTPAPSWHRRLAWMGLAFVPSGLLVSVTSHITTDVAAAPFLWVLPLALFLLTFVIAFQRRPLLPHKAMLAVQPVFVAALVVSMQFPFDGYWPLFLALHLAAFFISAMVCHGELVSRRPDAADLTQFYLWMSLGGALGGLFTGLVAPHVFSTVVEYPVMIVLALLARPGFWGRERKDYTREAAIAIGVLLVAAAPKLFMGMEVIDQAPKLYILAFVGLAILIVLARPNAVRLACVVSVTLLTGEILKSEVIKGENYRGFFGVNKVIETPGSKFRLLTHGTTLHGAQRLIGEGVRPPKPLTYYHRAGPFADVFRAARAAGGTASVGLVGLGTGSLACYRNEGERWTFFEIDPIVVRIASDASRFNFLSDCAPNARLIVGDARLTLANEPKGTFDVIVFDAFSSDAIPVHLLTREAVHMYLEKLAAGGVMAFHISNRNMDLRPVLAAVAKDLGLAALTRHGGDAGKLRISYKSAATVVAMARDRETLGPLARMDGWERLEDKGWRVWTDDYSDVLGAILASAGESGSASKK